MSIVIKPPLAQNLSPEELLLQLSQTVYLEKDLRKRASARTRLALHLSNAGAFDAAHDELVLANQEAPNFPYVQRALGLSLFRQGEILEGMKLYDEGRWQLPASEKLKRPYAFPQWKGQDLKGKKLLVWAEQGIGDQTLHARILPELAAMGAEISVECQPRLIPLLKRAMPKINFVTQTVPLVPEHIAGNFDFQVSMFSAWKWSKNPGKFCEYMKPNPLAVKRFRSKWNQLDGLGAKRLNVGLSWHSSAGELGQSKSFPLSCLQLLGKVAGERVRFHNVQYGFYDSGPLSKEFGAPVWVDSSTDPLKDVDRATAQLAALDLVISIDNATVQFAGAVNTPTWVLLPKGAEFRWQRHPTKSKFYPSLRLFRNTDCSNWAMPIIEVSNALKELLNTK